MDIQKIIRKHALANAVKYGGNATPGAVIGQVVSEAPETKKDMKFLAIKINEEIKSINLMSPESQKEELENLAPELLEKKKHVERTLPELKNPVNVVTRLAPFPSGPLHIGNARIAVLNDEYAKKYDGKMLLVIDDTIGSEEKQISPEAYDLIPQGLAWMGVKWSNIFYKSDRLEIYYDFAAKLIAKGGAYVCSCPSLKLRELREKGLECEHRNADVLTTKELWKKMLDGFFEEGQAILRIKTDMRNPNPAFRDRVLFRISERPHPRVGKKYRVWPMLEFSWAVDDNQLNVSHIIRGKELQIESDMERYIWNIFGMPDKETLHIGLLQLEGVKISKSKSRGEVEKGIYTGWDDPRTWSLQSLKRRGFQPEAIRTFILSFGINPNEITVPVDNLFSENRKLIEKDSIRLFFVKDPVEIRVTGATHVTSHLKKHPDYPEKGFRELKSNGQFFISKEDSEKIGHLEMTRLMDCLNFIKDDGYTFHSNEVEEYKKHGKRIVHWLPVQEGLIPAKVLMPDGETFSGLTEPEARHLKEGEIIQFERFGFCRYDHKEEDEMIFWFAHK